MSTAVADAVRDLADRWDVSASRVAYVATSLLARGYVEVSEGWEVPMAADVARRLLGGRVVYQRRLRRVALLRW